MASKLDIGNAIVRAYAYAIQLTNELADEHNKGGYDCGDASSIECLLWLTETLQYRIDSDILNSDTGKLYEQLLEATSPYYGDASVDANASIPYTVFVIEGGSQEEAPYSFVNIVLGENDEEVIINWSSYASLHGAKPIYIDLYQVIETDQVQSTSRVYTEDNGATYRWYVGLNSPRTWEVRIFGYIEGDTPQPPVEYSTITIVPIPSDAVVKINGATTTTATLAKGSSASVSVSKEGYTTKNVNITVPNTPTSYEIELQSISSSNYYWGEAGVIYAANPSNITQGNWDTIKTNGQVGNKFISYSNTTLPTSMQRDATGTLLAWWMILVPTSSTAMVASLSNYHWEIYDELLSQFVLYTDATYQGTVTLDGIEYTYRAIRPSTLTKIKYTL